MKKTNRIILMGYPNSVKRHSYYLRVRGLNITLFIQEKYQMGSEFYYFHNDLIDFSERQIPTG